MTALAEAERETTSLRLSALVVDAEENVRQLDKGTDEFKELVEDVKTRGIIEPVIVRYVDAYGEAAKPAMVLVAGFRRVAAARAAGLLEVPCRVLPLTDTEAEETRLAENLQRKDLSPIEEARAFERYLKRTDTKPKELAGRISKSPSYVAARLALLRLPETVVKLVDSGKLAPSHAEVLAKLPDDDQGHAVMANLARQAVQWHTPVTEFSRAVSQEAHAIQEQRRFQSLRDKAEHQTCPKCEAPAARLAPDHVSGVKKPAFMCGKGHVWNVATGAQPSWQKEQPRRAETSSERAQETREKNEKNLAESPVLRSYHPAFAILTKLLAELGPDRVHHVRIEGNRDDSFGHSEIQVVLTSGRAPMGLAGKVDLYPGGYSTGHKSSVIAQVREADEKRKLKRAFATWEKANLPAIKEPKPKAPPLSALDVAAVLDGGLGDVVPRLPDFEEGDGQENPAVVREKLEILRDAEAEGKGRGGAIDAIDRHLGFTGPYENYDY
jgi:ParB/RepB/Spo0J family partition protein